MTSYLYGHHNYTLEGVRTDENRYTYTTKRERLAAASITTWRCKNKHNTIQCHHTFTDTTIHTLHQEPYYQTYVLCTNDATCLCCWWKSASLCELGWFRRENSSIFNFIFYLFFGTLVKNKKTLCFTSNCSKKRK